MTKNLFAVYGASGYGREVMPLARDSVENRSGCGGDVLFIDDSCVETNINGHKVVTYEEFLAIKSDVRYVSIAIADGRVRCELAAKCQKDAVEPWGLVAKNIVILDRVDIGVGGVLSPFVTLTSNIKIGKYFQANLYSYIGHDCLVGDYVTFAPGVKCNGNVEIEDHAYIGTGAIIKQGRPGRPIRIGEGAIVGAGAVVTKNVAPGVTVIGNPARILSREGLKGG